MTQTIKTAGDVLITIAEVGADLQVRGWTRDEVQIDGDMLVVNAEPEANRVMISASGDCALYVPEGARIEIGRVGADAKLAGLSGAITIGSIGADLVARECGSFTIGRVGADARIRQAGNVQIDSIGADLTISQIDGSVAIGMAGADVYIREVSGDCTAEHVGADLILDLAFMPGHTYKFAVESDVMCRVGEAASVRFAIARDADVMVNVNGAETVKGEDGWQVVLGSGAATVTIDSPEDVRIVDGQSAFNPFVDLNLDTMFDRIFDRVSEESTRAAERMGARFKRQTERAAEHLKRQEEAMKRQEQQMRRQSEQMRRDVGRNAGPWAFSWGVPNPPRPPEPVGSSVTNDPVSDTERLTILRMVESRQITVEEAERLLSALNGTGGQPGSQGQARV